MKKYVYFSLKEYKPKTNVYSVKTVSDQFEIGIVKWYPGWRQYCFFPDDKTVWSKNCLIEIIDFIKKLMDERK